MKTILPKKQSTPSPQNTIPSLTRHNGVFLLRNVITEKLRNTLSRDAYWAQAHLENETRYETKDLGAAARYRKFADERTENLFRSLFQTHYELPKMPRLPGLDAHQRVGIEWVLKRKRSYLAHAPGAGKTAQAILASYLASGEGQTVFIVPPSLTVNWEREIVHFGAWVNDPWPHLAVVPTTNKKKNMDWSAQFIIVPDSMLTKDWVYEKLCRIKKKFIAVDEASRFKESLSERSIALYGGRSKGKTFSGLIRNTRHVVLMDGSPMPNRPIELWAPCYALHPESIDCMNYDAFGYYYCGAKPNSFGQWEYLYSSNETELKTKIQTDFMHVVHENELNHPERMRSMTFMSEDVRSAEQKSWERANFGSIRFDEKNSEGDLARFRRELGINKVGWASNYIRERLDKGESILVFAWHRDVCTGLADSFKDIRRGLVIGGMNSLMRERFFSEFQDGESKLLILNIAAGGRGHNLQRADRVIFVEWSWTDELNKQCEKRASRRGNNRQYVRCEYLVCPDSIDEMVLSSVFSKEKRVEKIIG